MNIFIYDSFLNQKKYEKVLARVETRITDLGLNGKISRLSIMKNIKEIVDFESKRGAKTIIAVGNDQTVNQVINSLADYNIPLGIIPIGDNNDIAKSLAIGMEEAACETLSARLITKLDLCEANSTYFLANASIPNSGTSIETNKNYTIEITEPGKTYIVNLMANINNKIKTFNPQDGTLELFIDAKKTKLFSKQADQSIFPIKKIKISNKNHNLLLDGVVEEKTPVEISIIKQKLKVIVGKDRNF